jgi:membrane fusion protein
MVIFAVKGQVTRKTRVPGVLMPEQGTVQLTATASGVLSEQLVREGEQVRAGQSLFVLGTDRASAEGSAAVLLAAHLAQRRATLEVERTARIQQVRQRELTLQERTRALDREIGAAEQESLLAGRRVALAQKTVGRYQQMALEGFFSDLQAQNKQEELIDLQARVESTQRNAAMLRREQQSVQAELQANQRQLNIDLALIERALVGLDQEGTENQSRKTIVIAAPQSGVVSTIHLPKGTTVQAGQSVATLVPMNLGGEGQPGLQARLQASLYAPSRTAGFIKPGQLVWMRYSAYPYQKFGLSRGQVLSVSTTPTAVLSQMPLTRIVIAHRPETIASTQRQWALMPEGLLEATVNQGEEVV